MLKVAFSLRMALLIASFGAMLGAGVIFWLGFYKLLHSIQEAWVPETINTKAIAARSTSSGTAAAPSSRSLPPRTESW